MDNILAKNVSAGMKQVHNHRQSAKSILVDLESMIKSAFHYETEKTHDFGTSLTVYISPHRNVLCGVRLEWNERETPDTVYFSVDVHRVPKLKFTKNAETREASYSKKTVKYAIKTLNDDVAKDLALLLEHAGFRLA